LSSIPERKGYYSAKDTDIKAGNPSFVVLVDTKTASVLDDFYSDDVGAEFYYQSGQFL
jgi:hypothetical protein